MSSKKELVYSGLKESIISHELKPGQIVNEAEIASRYGVSKTPVREALCELAVQRYINALPRAGYMITHITHRDIAEAYHLRQLLEVEAAALAAPRISEEEIVSLEQSLKASVRMVEEDEVAQFNATEQAIAKGFELNRTFHLTIARASGSQRLAQLIEQLLDEMRRIMALDPYLVLPRSDTEMREHVDVIEALKRRDVEAAKESMRRHMEKGRTRILARFNH